VASPVFQCNRCGTCCRNLIKKDPRGLTVGLSVLVEEGVLFPTNLISPQIALGREQPQNVIVHQVHVDRCPHIDSRDRCSIYERRPLACRAFPYKFSSFYGIATASPECPVIENQLKAGADKPTLFSKIEMEACNELELYNWDMFLKHMPARGKMWIFDLAERAWRECALGTPIFAF
jgi:Fe-S-cluster containining protein